MGPTDDDDFRPIERCAESAGGESAYNAQSTHHYHLGTGPVRRSTLADANRKRSPAPLEGVVRSLMTQVHDSVRKQSERALYLFDSTSLTLKGRHFDAWTAAARNDRTQGMKVHVMYALDAAAPVHQSMSMANVNDVTAARDLPIERDTTYVFDKGYCDYNWWASIHDRQATFVTRFKSNAALRVEKVQPVEDADKDIILADEIVQFAHKSSGGKRRNRYDAPLRRITVSVRPPHLYQARPDCFDALQFSWERSDGQARQGGRFGPAVWVWWLVSGSVDFRCGADRLLVHVREVLEREPLDGSAFVLTSFAVVKRFAIVAAPA